jgi:hypothetical protein
MHAKLERYVKQNLKLNRFRFNRCILIQRGEQIFVIKSRSFNKRTLNLKDVIQILKLLPLVHLNVGKLCFGKNFEKLNEIKKFNRDYENFITEFNQCLSLIPEGEIKEDDKKSFLKKISNIINILEILQQDLSFTATKGQVRAIQQSNTNNEEGEGTTNLSILEFIKAERDQRKKKHKYYIFLLEIINKYTNITTKNSLLPFQPRKKISQNYKKDFLIEDLSRTDKNIRQYLESKYSVSFTIPNQLKVKKKDRYIIGFPVLDARISNQFTEFELTYNKIKEIKLINKQRGKFTWFKDFCSHFNSLGSFSLQDIKNNPSIRTETNFKKYLTDLKYIVRKPFWCNDEGKCIIRLNLFSLEEEIFFIDQIYEFLIQQLKIKEIVDDYFDTIPCIIERTSSLEDDPYLNNHSTNYGKFLKKDKKKLIAIEAKEDLEKFREDYRIYK